MKSTFNIVMAWTFFLRTQSSRGSLAARWVHSENAGFVYCEVNKTQSFKPSLMFTTRLNENKICKPLLWEVYC